MVPLKDRLRILREGKDLSQIQIAEALNLRPGTYSSYENGVIPKTDLLSKIAQYHDVSMEYLLGLTNERKPAGGDLPAALTALTKQAGDASPHASDLTALFVAASRYYRRGAPCGDLPLQALTAFLRALTQSLAQAAAGDGPGLMSSANTAVIAALDIAKMPALYYENLKGDLP